MREMDAILDRWRGLEGRDCDAILATVVHVTGSAYRRPGGRMLIVPDGRRIGCVSGGCLEGEIVQKAWWFTESGGPVVRVYDTRSEDDAVWEFGLGCNGVVHVMLERVNTPAACELLDFLDAHRAARKPAAVATVIRTEAPSGVRVGDRLLLDESSAPVGTLCGSEMESQATLHAAAALREKKSRLAHIGTTGVFVEWIGPALSLAVFGAGHDSIPLVNFARQLGWDVTVADGRPAYAQPERFPGACRVVQLTASDLLRDVFIDSETAVVMMTHNYLLDLRLLPPVLALRPRYLGMLGPRERANRLFSELGLGQPACVHAPAGLDAGCDSPEAIALSIVAEIQAETNSRPGGKLKYRREPIHTAVYEVGLRPGEIPPEEKTAGDKAEAVRPSFCETITGSHV
jgi:xanthine dehydrogenase accessory factor